MPSYLNLVDAILAILVLEWLALRVFHRRSGRGVSPTAMAPNLLAGAALLLAWRCTLVEAAWFWSYLCLLAALVAHVTDLTQRWLRDPFTVETGEWRDPSQ
jgi:hypothetical protein